MSCSPGAPNTAGTSIPRSLNRHSSSIRQQPPRDSKSLRFAGMSKNDNRPGMITGAVAHPTFERLMKRGPVTATRTILWALFGNIPAIIAIIGTVLVRRDLATLSEAVSGSWRAIAFGTAVGALSSAVFWSVAGPQIASTQLMSQGGTK